MESDGQDPIAFFGSFERVLILNEVPRAGWGKILPAYLSPKALKIYSKLSLEQARDFDEVKYAILNDYKLDAAA